MLDINQTNLSGRLTANPKVDVIKSKAAGEGKTVVTFDILYYHPHDLIKKYADRRVCYAHIRTYGKTGEAAQRNLIKGDEVLIMNGVRVQDSWTHTQTKQTIRKDYVEPPPMGLKYTRCQKLNIGTPRPKRMVDKENEVE